MEQLYPFPEEELLEILSAYPEINDAIWCQEEPRNNGAWFFVESQIEQSLIDAGHKDMRPRYAGRDAAASPATGLASRHLQQQEALVADALGLDSTPIKSSKKKA